MSSRIFYLIFAAVLSCTFLTSCDSLTLDEYCFNQLPPSKRILSAKISFMRLILMCSNIDMYSECLVTTRLWSIRGIELKIYERTFPSDSDIYKAGYLFCTMELFNKVGLYSINENSIVLYEENINYQMCKYQVGEIKPQNDPDKDNALFCNATIKYYRCLRDQYMHCAPANEYLFRYFIARVGPECLLAQNENLDMLVEEVCESSQAINNAERVSILHGWAHIGGLTYVIKVMWQLA
ncbi:hypothetical protein Btru_032077 [Bulinus truncatus]|nr:hypothetical protein Btru_032077 [Bulinus truncatus]